MAEVTLLVSCEHAVNHVPEPFTPLFEGQEALLESHRAYDPGARQLAVELAGDFGTVAHCSRVTRLLIDHNRSPANPSLWSAFSRGLDPAEKQFLSAAFYAPFRRAVANQIAADIERGKLLLHLSVHSFTPVLNHQIRRTQLGLLYDPRRGREKKFAACWKQQLQQLEPELRVHRNAPYRGSSDCHQRSYRLRYAESHYLALELEVNQSLVAAGADRWQQLKHLVLRSLRNAIAENGDFSRGSE